MAWDWLRLIERPGEAAAEPGAEAWMVFGMRALLALSTLLSLYIGPSGIELAWSGASLIFTAYLMHSLVLLYVARRRAGFWHGTVVYWVDIGWYGLMVYAGSGAPNPFFTLFFFAILAASFRHGFDAGARLTLGAAVVVITAVLAAHGTRTLHLLLLRVTFLLGLGYMIAFWGGLLLDQRRRLALLRDVSRLSNPRFGVQHTIDSLMGKLLRFYGGHTCLLLMEERDGRWMLNTARYPNSGRAVRHELVEGAAVAPLMALEPDTTVLYGGGARALHLAAGAGVWARIDAAACAGIADLLDTRSFMSVTLPLRKGSGRLFLSSERPLRRADASFLNHIVQQAFPVIETIHLLDRLASDAAFRERQTIARDLHDSAIQPYIGLRHALAAIRSQAGAGNPLTPELERLLAMSNDVVADMRHFAQRFRDGRQQEPELLLALRRQLGQVRAFYDIAVTLDARRAPLVHDRLAAEVFQIVAEGVNNICKHTRARCAEVVLADEDGQLAIDIANPRPPDDAALAFMPKSIAGRVGALGGTLEVKMPPGHTLLRIRVPA